MLTSRLLRIAAIVLPLAACGCGATARDLQLDADLARTSLEQALKAWVDGKKPDDLKPDIIVGDAAWNAGKTLVSYEVKKADEKSDGTNLYIPVVCQFRDAGGRTISAETNYIVGTSPVITIFPQ